MTCPEPVAGRRGRHWGAWGRKDENLAFWGVLVPLEGGLIVLILTLSYRSQKTED